MGDRIPCLVPFCRRTAKRRPDDRADAEIICGPHFRLADKSKRRRLTKLYRIYARAPEDSRRRFIAARLWFREWDVIKDQAISRAMGA